MEKLDGIIRLNFFQINGKNIASKNSNKVNKQIFDDGG